MTDTKSKADERWYAARLGTTRTPLSGGNSRHTRSDTLDPDIYLEVKTGKSFPVSWEGWGILFGQVSERAHAERKVPVLVLHPNRQPREDAFTFIDLGDVGIMEVIHLVQVPWSSFEAFCLPVLRGLRRERPTGEG